MRHFERFESGSGLVEPPADRTRERSEDRPSRSGILVDALTPQARIIVTTRNSRYRFVVIDAADRRIQITGGKLFKEPTEMLLEGSIADDGGFETGWIRVGLPLSLSTGLRRITTSRVESVAFERVPAAIRAA